MRHSSNQNHSNSVWPLQWHTQTYQGETISWSEDIRASFSAVGLDQCRKIMSFYNCFTQADKCGYRDVTRLQIDEDNVFYLKRYLRLRRTEYLSAILRPFSYPSSARREWEQYHILNNLGISTAIPVAWGEKKSWGIPSLSFIITRQIVGTPLDEYLRNCRDFHVRRAVLYSMANAIKHMHRAGYQYPDYTAKHIYVKNTDVVLLNAEKFTKLPNKAPMSMMVRDLANLSQTIPTQCATNTERLRFLKYYLDCAHLGSQAKIWIGNIQRHCAYISQNKKKPIYMWHWLWEIFQKR